MRERLPVNPNSIASKIVVFPYPFGPTKNVIPSLKSITVSFLKFLKL